MQSLSGVAPTTTPVVDIDPAAVGRFRYSGGGYSVVQQLIEDVSGSSFAETARELVLNRLEMTRSTFLQPPPEPLRASLARDDWHFYPESAAAGLWTTARDLGRFVSAVQAAATGKPTPLTQQTAKAMLDPRVSLPSGGEWRPIRLVGIQPPQSAGLGLFVRQHRFINLGGAAKSFSALTGSSETGTGAIVMTTGCRTPVVFRILLQLSDIQGWSDFRTSPRHLRGLLRRTSNLLLRAVS